MQEENAGCLVIIVILLVGIWGINATFDIGMDRPLKIYPLPKDTNLIGQTDFLPYEVRNQDGDIVLKQGKDLIRWDNCNVFDSNNWKCDRIPPVSMIDGVLYYWGKPAEDITFRLRYIFIYCRNAIRSEVFNGYLECAKAPFIY